MITSLFTKLYSFINHKKYFLILILCVSSIAVALPAYAKVTINGTGLQGDSGINIDGIGILNFGIASTTGITLGKTGLTVTVPGSLSVASHLILSGITSGITTIQASSTAGNWTLTLPPTAGNAGQAMLTDGNGNLYFGSVSPTVARSLNGPGLSAKCQAGVAAAGFSLSSSNAPAAVCESDGIQGYLNFTSGLTQNAYDRFDLPSDWTGTMKAVITAYSTGTTAPTINVYLSCISNGTTASPAFGTTPNAISLTPVSGSGRTSVVTTLNTDTNHATKTCAAGDLVEWKLAVQANSTDLRILSVRFTE